LSRRGGDRNSISFGLRAVFGYKLRLAAEPPAAQVSVRKTREMTAPIQLPVVVRLVGLDAGEVILA
jgi:hypothetical protein